MTKFLVRELGYQFLPVPRVALLGCGEVDLSKVFLRVIAIVILDGKHNLFDRDIWRGVVR